MSLKFVYQDQDLFVLDKPARLHSVGQKDSAHPSLAELLGKQSPELREVSERPEDYGLINRLDFETSGLILGAKTTAVWKKLRAQIQAGAIKKSYRALVEGIFSEKKEVATFLGNPNRGAPKVRVFEERPKKKERALPARSVFEPVSSNAGLNFSVVRVWASTARRHQVRAHAAHVGHPLIGDRLYGSLRNLNELFPEREGGFLLHADYLEFEHPVSGEVMRFEVAANW